MSRLCALLLQEPLLSQTTSRDWFTGPQITGSSLTYLLLTLSMRMGVKRWNSWLQNAVCEFVSVKLLYGVERRVECWEPKTHGGTRN